MKCFTYLKSQKGNNESVPFIVASKTCAFNKRVNNGFDSLQGISCHHCNHHTCLPKTKLTCYSFVKRGGGGGHGYHNGDSNCACQPEDYCDGFYSCHNWPCPDSGNCINTHLSDRYPCLYEFLSIYNLKNLIQKCFYEIIFAYSLSILIWT